MTLILYDYYCTRNLISPLVGSILPYCTGGYCPVQVVMVTSDYKRNVLNQYLPVCIVQYTANIVAKFQNGKSRTNIYCM